MAAMASRAPFRRLVHRNIALLVCVVLAGQLLAGVLVLGLVINPQVTRVAVVTTSMIETLSRTLDELPPRRQAELLAAMNRDVDVAIRPETRPPSDGPRFPTAIERLFMRAVAHRLSSQPDLVWRTDAGRRLWVRLRLGRDYYWVSITPPRSRGAMTSLLTALFAAFVVSVAGGLALQRHFDRPLLRLKQAVDDYDPDRPGSPLDEDGPEEIAAVAHAFNRMTARLAEQDAERALMLAGVSHDLRTPLTRLRLSLAMMHGVDPQLEESATRQVDRIEAMLHQFLDYARGFESEPFAMVTLKTLLARSIADSDVADRTSLSVPDDLVARVRPMALGRAIANLLGNAARHGAAPFRVEASLCAPELVLAVCDSGPGMDEETARRLRTPFARGDSARGGDGAGLGLAIVERVAAAHGGALSFEKRPDCFAAVLRLRYDGGRSGAPIATGKSAGESRKSSAE